MPLYTFEFDGIQKDILLGMNDKKEYTDELGNKWTRIYHVPQASINTKIDPFSAADFVNKTGQKKGTIGDLWDKSAELSHEREQKLGKDQVKEDFYADYSKTRNGLKHPAQKREEAKKKLKKLGVSLD
jgi:hypothetical protein